MLSFQIMSCLLPAPKCVHVWLCSCAGRHMQIHVKACLESPPYCACCIFLWKSPLRVLLFSLNINSRAEKLHQSCFLLACPPVEKGYEVCWSEILGGGIPVALHASKLPVPPGLRGFCPRRNLVSGAQQPVGGQDVCFEWVWLGQDPPLWRAEEGFGAHGLLCL